MPDHFIPWPGKAIAVFEVFIIQVEDDHRINVTDPKFTGKLDLHHRLLFVLSEQHQRARRSGAREDRKLNAIRYNSGSERKRSSASKPETLMFVRRVVIDAAFHSAVRLALHLSLYEIACSASGMEPASVKKFRNPVCDITVRMS